MSIYMEREDGRARDREKREVQQERGVYVVLAAWKKSKSGVV